MHWKEAFGSMAADHLTERHIDLYLKQSGRAPGTLQVELANLRQAFKIAQRKKLLASIPHIPTLKFNNAREGFFEADAFERVVSFLPDVLQDVIRLAYYTGWRSGEITGLEWRYIQDDIVRLPPELSKNSEGRVLVLTGVLAEIIERRRAVRYELSRWVFHRKGKQIKDFRYAWKRACEQAGVPGHYVHDFRRTAVRNLTRAGVPEKIALSITGHKTRAVFDRYNIVNEEDIREGLQRTFARLSERKVRFFSSNIVQNTDTAQ